MNKNRTCTGLLLAAAAALGLSAASAATEMKFIMCGGEVRPADQKVIDQFQIDHPDVVVDMEAIPWGTCQDKSTTLAAAGDPPSIAYMGSRTLLQLSQNDLIVPVNIPSGLLPHYQPGVLDTVRSGGKHWGFPHAFSTKALFMNCDLIEAAGAQCKRPRSWDELYDIAKAVKDNLGIGGIGVTGKDFDNTMHQFLVYLYSNDGQVVDPDTNEITLDSKNTVETLEFYGKLGSVAQEGPTAFERSQLRDLFNDSKVAMYIDGPWARGQHNEELTNNITVPVPGGPSSSGGSGSLLITDSLAVFNGTGHEETAMMLAEALATGAAQYDLDSSWGLTPILQYEKLLDEKPYYEGDSYWNVFIEPIRNSGPEPLFVEYKSLQTVMNSMIQGMLLNEDSAANLVSQAAEELEELL